MGQNSYQKRVGAGAGQGAVQGGTAGAMIGAPFGGFGAGVGGAIGAGVGGLYGGVMGDQAYHKDQRMQRRADSAGQTQGLMARQQAISGGLGGGGVQTQADVGGYNRVLSQYTALRQAMEMQRMAQQQQMWNNIGMFGGAMTQAGQPQQQTWMGSGS